MGIVLLIVCNLDFTARDLLQRTFGIFSVFGSRADYRRIIVLVDLQFNGVALFIVIEAGFQRIQ